MERVKNFKIIAFCRKTAEVRWAGDRVFLIFSVDLFMNQLFDFL